MNLLEKMFDLEEVLVEHVFVDLGDDEETTVTREVDKDNQLKTFNNHKENEKTLVGETFLAKEQYEEIF
jgi:hypothetical protein